MKRFLPAFALVLGLFAVQLVASGYIVTPSTILVDPTQNLQAAIDAMAAYGYHGTVRLGPGTYVLSAGLVLPAGIELRGDGMSATNLRCDAVAGMMNTDVITVTGNDCKISDMTIYGYGGTTPYSGDSSQAGIRVAGLAGVGDGANTETVISGLVIERVVIANTLTRAISLGTTAGATAPSRARYGLSIGHTLVITATVRDCRFTNILGNSSESELYVAPGSTTVMVEGTYFQILDCPGARMSESRGVKLLSCVFEDAGTYAPSFVYLGGQNFNISVDGCWFEKHGGGGLVPFVYCYHRNHGITLRDSHFVRTYADSSYGTLAGTTITVRGDQYVGVLGTSGAHAYTPRLDQTTLALISGCTAYTNNTIPSDTTCVFVSPDDNATLDVVTIENSYCSSVDIINSAVALEARTRAMSGCVPTGFTLANHIKRPSVVGL